MVVKSAQVVAQGGSVAPAVGRHLRRPALGILLVLLGCPLVPNLTFAQAALDASTWGDFEVGHQRWDAISADREIWIDIWYPADAEGTTGADLTAYGIVPGNAFAFPSDHAFAGVPPSMSGPFPLIAFSHGSLSFSAQSSDMAEQLASHGFVVAAPNHTGNATADVFTFEASMRDMFAALRITDLTETIDAVVASSKNANHAFLALVDDGRIGVAGHSFGGGTARDVANADPRVDALFQLSTRDLTVPLPNIPSLFVGGTNDGSTSFLPRIFTDFMTAEPRFMAIVEDADHVSYIDICNRSDMLQADPEAPAEAIAFYDALATEEFDTCVERAIDNELATTITNTIVVAFFQSTLADERSFDRFLKPNYVANNELPVELSFVGFQPIPDYNSDGHVNEGDYLYWKSEFGKNVDHIGDGADGNLNLIIDAADYTVWRDSFVGPAEPLANTADGGPVGEGHYHAWMANDRATSGARLKPAETIPEPSSWPMGLTIGVVVFSRYFWRR